MANLGKKNSPSFSELSLELPDLNLEKVKLTSDPVS